MEEIVATRDAYRAGKSQERRELEELYKVAHFNDGILTTEELSALGRTLETPGLLAGATNLDDLFVPQF